MMDKKTKLIRGITITRDLNDIQTITWDDFEMKMMLWEI